MKRLSYALATLSLATLPTAADAAGLYIEGFGGVTSLSDYTLDAANNNLDSDVSSGIGWNVGAAVGAKIPLGIVDMRVEGEVAYRRNSANDVTIQGVTGDTVNDSKTSALSGMANAHLDYHVLPQLAVTAGGGIGYASVTADIAANINGNGLAFVEDQSDGVFAYQLMTGVRYDITPNITASLGYRYFTTGDPEVEIAGSNGQQNFTFEYSTHNFNAGLAYGF